MKEANGKVSKLMEHLAAATTASIPDDPAGASAAYPREFFHSRFVYAVISARARGLSLGVNMNPDKRCQFNCLYCEVDRSSNASGPPLDVPLMATELKRSLELVHSG